MKKLDDWMQTIGVRLYSKILGSQNLKKSWSNLWATDKSLAALFGNKVTKPYKQVSSVYKAVKAIADNVPQAKLVFHDDKGNETYPDKLDHLLKNPNPLQSWNDFLQKCIGFLALKGEMFIVKTTSIGQEIGSNNIPAELWTFNPDKFKEIIENGQLVGWRYGSQIRYSLDEVIHIKDFNPDDDWRGLSPLDPIEKIIDIDYQSLIYNKAFFDNNALPNAFLTSKEGLDDDARKRLGAWLKKSFQGSSKGFKTAILEGDIDIKTIAQSHKDMEFIEQKKFTREEILGTWRAPKALFNITDDLNYATFMGQMKVFWLYGLMPYLRKFEDGFNRHLIWQVDPRISCKFDLSQVPAFQEDLKEKAETAERLSKMGFTGNEINAKLGLGFEDKPWRDKFWIPFSLTPAGEKPEPVADPKDSKSLPNATKTQKVIDSSVMWKQFVNRHTPIETKFASMLKRYFYEQRKLVLSEIEEKGIKKEISISINWVDQDGLLKKKAEPYLKAGMDQGVELAEDVLGISGANQDVLKVRLDSFFKLRAQEITKVNKTIKNQIQAEIMAGTEAGETTVQIADRVRHIYNMAANRSLTIARTEVTGTMNAGSSIYYDASGVKKKEWVVADGEARDSHIACASQGAIRMNQNFVNGLDFPGGAGPAGEVINCRCTLIPVIETV